MKINKIVIISLILLAILTFGAASAAEDVTVDDSADLDSINLDANGDIAIDDLSTDVETIDDGSDAIGDEEAIIEDSKEKLGSSKLSEDSQIVTSANLNDFFDANGNLKSTVTGNLTFQGEFIGTGNKLTLNKAITINSDNAVLKDIGIEVYAANIKLDGLSFICTSEMGDLISVQGNGAVLTNLNINYVAGDFDATAIHINGADDIEITDSNIYFESGVTDDSKYGLAINVEDAEEVLIEGNDITTSLPALYVASYDYTYMMMGLNTVNPVRFWEATGVFYRNNKQNSTVNDVSADFPTTQSIYIVACEDVHIENNDFSMIDELTPEGTTVYIYGFTFGYTTDSYITGNNFNISTNGGDAAAGTAYAIQVVASELNITGNNITSKSNGPNLGIYSASMMGEDSQLYIADNFINVTGYAISTDPWGLVSGIEIQNGVGQIYNNTIYTYNTQDYTEGDYLFGVSYAQYMYGNRAFDIRDNVIVTEGPYAVSVIDADSLNVTGNTLIAHDLVGDDAINPGSCTETEISDNTEEMPPAEMFVPIIEITANNVWNGSSNDIVISVSGLDDTATVPASGNVTVRINGKEETIELINGQVSYTIPAEYINEGENTVTVDYNGADNFETGTSTATFKTLDGIVTNATFFDYFDSNNSGRLYDYVPEGATLDFQGAFISSNRKFIR